MSGSVRGAGGHGPDRDGPIGRRPGSTPSPAPSVLVLAALCIGATAGSAQQRRLRGRLRQSLQKVSR